ncbi:MAG TPA: ubiquinol-cytochrome c reductase cytochrome b subunit [Kineosporiaceae bacterium]|nr:ubiquinol-cytochrome c reductase cytochrome b subunit [Kineosporiaceae bacterium]
MSTTTTSPAASLGNFADERVGAAKTVKAFARKIFPDHWSFMLGEVALYSFIILLLTGVFLTFFYVPSVGETTYHGAYAPLEGQKVSEAFASTLRLSFDIRGGLLLRQIHHWAALLFVAAMIVHMFRVFFTGAFRKPRELNWVIGSVLAILAVFEGFAGYSLPDDLLSGNGLRIAEGIVLSIPVVGTYVSFFLFGGQFPGEIFIPRLYTIHVLLLPGIFLALITAHLLLLVVQKHTQYPGPGRTNDNVVGYPLYPVYIAKAGGFFFIVFGVTALLSAIFQINPVWIYGQYDPSPISAGAQPDWYMGFMDGAVRLIPGWFEFTAFGHTFSLNILLPAFVLPGVLTTLLAIYPWLEAWVTGDRREHHLLDRPRNAPVRTGLGVMAITFYVLLWISGGNDIVATHLKLSINDITNTLRLLVIALPPLTFLATKRICMGLQRKDREKVLHGRETGVIYRTEAGEYFEVHAPLEPQAQWVLVQHETYRPLELEAAVDENGVARPSGRFTGMRRRLAKFYFEDRIEPVTPAELAAAHNGHGHHAVESGDGAQAQVTSGH